MTVPVPLEQQAAMANVILNANTAGYNQGMQGAAAQTGLLSKQLDGVDNKLKGIVSRAGHGMFNFAKADFASLAVATGIAGTFEKQLATLSATAAVTGQSMNGIKSSVESSFNKFPVSRASVIALTESLEKLGVSGSSDLDKLTQTFIKLGAATGEGPQELAAGLVQLSRLMGSTNATQIGNFANSLLTVSAKAGVSATSVLNFAQSIAPLARQAGIGEAAVIGISTAFSKAGADGFVAANTFNSMISQITQLTASGSPDIAKYANLIGVTVAQFKGMDKTTALTEIFEAINKEGPGAIDTLNRLGFDGVRTLSSIQAVAQSGDLRTQVATALGATGDQGNLDKASKAAFGGLVDQGAQLRNTFTQLGTVIGTTFLTPLTKVLSVVNMVVGSFVGMAKAAGPLLGIAGIFLTIVGAVLATAKAVGTLALLSTVIRSGPVAAAREGFGTRAAPNVIAMSPGAQRPWNAPFFRAGQRAGAGAQATGRYVGARSGETEETRVARDRAVIAGGGRLPFDRTVEESAAQRAAARAARPGVIAVARGAAVRGGRALINANAEFLGDAARPGYQRQAPMLTAISGGVQRANAFVRGAPAPAPIAPIGPQAGRLRTFAATRVAAASPQMGAYQTSITSTVSAQAKLIAAQEAMTKATAAGTVGQKIAAMETLANAKIEASAAIQDQTAKREEAKAAVDSAFAQKGVAKQALALISAFAKLELASAKAGTKMVGTAAAAITPGGGMGMLKGLGATVGLTAGIPLALGAISMIKDKAQAANDAFGANMNPVSKYNDQLGIATTNLATFASATATASDKLNGVNSNTSLKDAEKVSDSDVLNAQGTKSADKTISAAYNKNDATGQKTAALKALLPGYDMSDPRQIQLFKNNALAAGFNRSEVEGALGSNSASGTAGGTKGTDFTVLAKRIAATEGKGAMPMNTSDKGTTLGDSAVTQIGLDYNTNQGSGAAYAGQKRLADEVSLFTSQLQAAPTDLQYGGTKGGINLDQIAGEMKTVLGGGDSDTYAKSIINNAQNDGNVDKMSTEQIQALVIKAMGSTDEGKRALANLQSVKGTTLDPTQFTASLQALLASGNASSPDQQVLARAGDLGLVAAGDKNVLAAKATPADQALQTTGTNSLLQDAQSLNAGGAADYSGTEATLDKFMVGIGDTTSDFYILAQSAKALNAAQEAAATASMNRAGKLATVNTDYVTALQGQQAGNPDDTADFVASKKAAYDQAAADQQQFMIQTQQALLANQVQVKRASDANDLQVANSKRDFQTSQLYALNDYNLQVLRTNQDFATQMARQAQSAAQTIYDPYTRIQYKMTDDASTLLMNLTDQNAHIAEQLANLNKLADMGVSQQSIDTLDLSNPDNAQQTNALVTSLTQDPALVKQINDAVTTRLQATTDLTQNAFSMTFRNTTADFSLQIDRGASDFGTATDRAIAAQTLALSDMAKAFALATLQANQDLDTSMTAMLANTGDQINTAINTLGPLLNQLPANTAAAYNAMFTQVAASAAAASIKIAGLVNTKAITPAGTMGVNSAGDYGYYLTSGEFAKYKGSVSPEMYSSAPRITDLSGHAAGGVSTFAHDAHISEGNKTETIIPLDERGIAFMSNFISQVSMAMVRQMSTSQLPGVPSGSAQVGNTTYTVDSSTQFNGPLTVQASDPDAMAKALAGKARLARLSRPTASTAGAA